MMKYYCIIPAAGTGLRFASEIPKQYLSLNGSPILQQSIQPFLDHPLIEKVVVVLNANDSHWQHLSIAKHPKIMTVIGGEVRRDSVINGLKHLEGIATSDDWILVHDGARPFIRINEINYLIQVLNQHPVGGLLGVPIRETVKKISAEGEVVNTMDRSELWHAHTPQMFRYDLLKRSLEAAKANDIVVTDDSSALELAGYKPLMVEGSPGNTKITFVEDIERL